MFVERKMGTKCIIDLILSAAQRQNEDSIRLQHSHLSSRTIPQPIEFPEEDTNTKAIIKEGFIYLSNDCTEGNDAEKTRIEYKPRVLFHSMNFNGSKYFCCCIIL